MIARKAAHPCTTCRTRKTKCDRMLPSCTSCVDRAEIQQCTYKNHPNKRSKFNPKTNRYDGEMYQLWDDYERLWLRNILGQMDSIECTDLYPNLSSFLADPDIYFEFITEELSYKLLDYSMERLGNLYFGIFSDIGELYAQLDRFWDNIRNSRSTDVNDILWDLILRSVLVMTIYYLSDDQLEFYFQYDKLNQYIHPKSEERLERNEELQVGLYDICLKSTLAKLLNIMNVIPPNIKIIQIFLILSNTSFLDLYSSLGNNILVHCIHLAKALNLNEFKIKINDSTSSRLTKTVTQKIWYRLSVIDYSRCSPNKMVLLHTENSSLLYQTSLILNAAEKDQVDVYDSEDSWESFYWKITSLDRDLNEYKIPSMKSLQSMKKYVSILQKKLTAEVSESVSSKFEAFILKLKCNFVLWKIAKFEFTHYDISNGFDKLCNISQHILGLFLLNIKYKTKMANRYPSCFHMLATIAGFHTFNYIFHDSPENEQLMLDILEVLETISSYFQATGYLLNTNLFRLQALKKIWKTVKVIDTGNQLIHPVTFIMKQDIVYFKKTLKMTPQLLTNILVKLYFDETEEENPRISKEFRKIVHNFDKEHPLCIKIKNYNSS